MFLWLALVGYFVPTAGFSCDSAEEEALIQKLPGLEIQHRSLLSLEDAKKTGADFVSVAKPMMLDVEIYFLHEVLSTLFALDHKNLV